MTRLHETALLRDLVCERFDIDRKKLLHGGRQQRIADARHVLAWSLRTRRLSYPDIGAEMAGRDHTTAMNSVAVVDNKPSLMCKALDVLARFELEVACAEILGRAST